MAAPAGLAWRVIGSRLGTRNHQLLGEGNSNKEIARRLTLSIKTVETHRAAVMRKLELKSLADIIRWAIRNDVQPKGERSPAPAPRNSRRRDLGCHFLGQDGQSSDARQSEGAGEVAATAAAMRHCCPGE